MPITIMAADEAAERFKQARKSALETLEEWRNLKVKLGAGLKRGTAIVVELPKDSKIKNLRSTFKRRARNYVHKLQLGYEVRAMQASGKEVVIITNNESEAPVSRPNLPFSRKNSPK